MVQQGRGRKAWLALWLCVLLFAGLLAPAQASAVNADEHRVRVGYYENEVFEEGAREGAVKTGYAYEYYQKLSEYAGWKYDYVYGEFGELYQMLLDGEIDLLAGLAWREDREGLIGYPDKAMGNESYNLIAHDTDEGFTTDPARMIRSEPSTTTVSDRGRWRTLSPRSMGNCPFCRSATGWA